MTDYSFVADTLESLGAVRVEAPPALVEAIVASLSRRDLSPGRGRRGEVVTPYTKATPEAHQNCGYLCYFDAEGRMVCSQNM